MLDNSDHVKWFVSHSKLKNKLMFGDQIRDEKKVYFPKVCSKNILYAVLVLKCIEDKCGTIQRYKE